MISGAPALGFSIVEGAEGRELLAVRLRRVECQAACRQAVLLVAANSAKIARTLEHDIFVVDVGRD